MQKTPIAYTCVSRHARATQGARVGEREHRWAEPPTRDRPRICKRSFQLTATMAWRIGRCAANSKPIRRVHARKSSTSSAPNTSRRTGLIPRDHAVRTDVYRGGYLRRNCAMSLTGLHFAQTNLCSEQYCSTKNNLFFFLIPFFNRYIVTKTRNKLIKCVSINCR